MANEKQYWSRGGFGYADLPYTDVGQVITLKGQPKDEALVRLGHFREIDKGAKFAQCGKCGAKFISEGHLNRHGQDRHGGPLTPQQELERDERAAKFANTVAPIKYENSRAQGARA